MTRSPDHSTAGYEPKANGPRSSALHTAGACRADLWASSDNPVHRAFAPELESWAARAEARAAAAERGGQMDMFEVVS